MSFNFSEDDEDDKDEDEDKDDEHSNGKDEIDHKGNDLIKDLTRAKGN